MHKLGLAIFLLVSTVSGYRIAVLNDIHYDPNYKGDCGALQCLDMGYYT